MLELLKFIRKENMYLIYIYIGFSLLYLWNNVDYKMHNQLEAPRGLNRSPGSFFHILKGIIKNVL